MKNTAKYKRIHIQSKKNNYPNFLIRKKALHNYDLHWHDCFEIELILNGYATQELNGFNYSLGKGDIYLLNPTDFHKVNNKDAEVYNIMFSEEFINDNTLQKLLSVNNNLCFHLNEEEFESVSFLIRLMLKETEKHDNYSYNFIKQLLECIFIIILRKCKNFTNDKKTSDIKKALLYIHSNFQKNPTMTDIAKLVGFNSNYFSGLFHKVTGKTFKEYLKLLKLEHAKKLILSSELSITEICFESGFNSLSNFLRAFKKHYNVSPNDMRKENKER